MANDLEVLVIGGGLSGVSTAYHLINAGVENILLLEAGKIGCGSDEMLSGTAGPLMPRHSKMISTPFESDYETFSEKHGDDGAKTYLELMIKGGELQKSLARYLNPGLVRQLGTLVVGHGIQWQWLKEEHEAYQELGFGHDYQRYSRGDISRLFSNKKSAFDGGLFVPQDAIIDQDSYLQALARSAHIPIFERTKVLEIQENPDYVWVRTDTRGEVTADNVVIATNGFYEDDNLKGILEQKWTFIISYTDKGPNTPNAWDFADDYHYWTRQDDFLMVGGEDRNVLKGNTKFYKYLENAVGKLERWANEKFPQTIGQLPVVTHYGVFTITPDEIPIVGTFSEDSRIAYIVSCNGNGQPSLSYGASLMPAWLGYKDSTIEQKRFAEFMSPRRPMDTTKKLQPI